MQRLIGTVSAFLSLAVAATALAQGTALNKAPARVAEKPAAASAERQGVLRLLTQLESSFNEGDAKGAAACWTENGDFVGPGGARAEGREAIEKQFTEALAARKGSKLQMQILNFRLVNDSLALIDAVPEIKSAAADSPAPAVRTAAMVLVKQNGRWLIESAHETSGRAAAQANRLKELEWLVGDWASETSKAGISLHTACDWTANQAFLIRKFKVEGKEVLLHGGTEILGWDPRANRIRSWVFDADGSFGENVWVRDGDRWLIRYAGTLADGSEASATHVLTKVDAQTATLQSRDRVVNGERQPDVPEVTIKRQAAEKTATKADEASKPVKKSQP
jgi:uncharacterized protein (TIGR02246 family)